MTEHAAAIVRQSSPHRPRGVVLMLHGGAEHNSEPVTERSRSLWRTLFMYDAIHPRLLGAGLAVMVLKYATVGWNDPANPSPVPDARWALDQIGGRFGDLPVGLLGHSMGARTALAVADADPVRGVVGLAPWFPADEDLATIAGKRLVGVHGTRDTITRASATLTMLDRAEGIAASTTYVDMGPVGHYMLRHVRDWNRTAIRQTLSLFESGPTTT